MMKMSLLLLSTLLLMPISVAKKAKDIGFIPKITLKEGIDKTINWFLKSNIKNKRYNSFTEKI